MTVVKVGTYILARMSEGGLVASVVRAHRLALLQDLGVLGVLTMLRVRTHARTHARTCIRTVRDAIVTYSRRSKLCTRI